MNSEAFDLQMKRAQERLENQKSFIRRNYFMWVFIAYLMYPAATIFSAYYEGQHIFVRMKEVTGNFGGALLLTGMLVLMLEGSKYFLKLAVDDWQAGALHKGGADAFGFIVKIIWGLVALGFSIYLSLEGAKKISTDNRENRMNSEVALISIDSINTVFDQRLAPYQASAKSYQGTTWKGVMTAGAIKAAQANNKTISQIEDQRAAAVEKANLENQARLEKYQSTTVQSANYATTFAGIAEFVILLCVVFIGIYDDGVRKEVLAGK
jgi:hypothetical protein